jgi:ribonucleotide reductase beta subunit family protein with ferritin-like domain
MRELDEETASFEELLFSHWEGQAGVALVNEEIDYENKIFPGRRVVMSDEQYLKYLNNKNSLKYKLICVVAYPLAVLGLAFVALALSLFHKVNFFGDKY